MHWIEPNAKDTASTTLEQRLWDAADRFRAGRRFAFNLPRPDNANYLRWSAVSEGVARLPYRMRGHEIRLDP